MYICEKILKKRVKKGNVEYLIKWKNYPLKESTWEPVHNILDPELLTSFEDESNRRKSNKKKPVKRSSRALTQTPEPPVSPQENRGQSSLNQSLSPTPSSQTTKTRTPTPAPLEPLKSPIEVPDQSSSSNSTLPASSLEPPTKTRPPTPKLEQPPANGVIALYKPQPQTSPKAPSPRTRTSEVQTSPRPHLSNKSTIYERPLTVITDVTFHGETLTISESLRGAL